MTQVRTAAVAGTFYPADAVTLGATVQALLREAPPWTGPAPKALIVPHAGYIYSGPVAAAAYASLSGFRDRYQRVVLLGPSHHLPLRGMAACSASAFLTPLGEVPLETPARTSSQNLAIVTSDYAHRFEHSLEVQLPFLQTALDDFVLIPLAAGRLNTEEAAGVIESLWGGDETLVVISTDLSHFLDYDQAQKRDSITCRSIESLDPSAIGPEDACGCAALNGFLLVARRRGLHITTVALQNSGDTAGDHSRVVGYGAWVLTDTAMSEPVC